VGVLYSHGTVLGSADYTTNADGDVRSWADYDVWGSPKAGVSHDLNLAVITTFPEALAEQAHHLFHAVEFNMDNAPVNCHFEQISPHIFNSVQMSVTV
jgi:hypothetical protein